MKKGASTTTPCTFVFFFIPITHTSPIPLLVSASGGEVTGSKNLFHDFIIYSVFSNYQWCWLLFTTITLILPFPCSIRPILLTPKVKVRCVDNWFYWFHILLSVWPPMALNLCDTLLDSPPFSAHLPNEPTKHKKGTLLLKNSYFTNSIFHW